MSRLALIFVLGLTACAPNSQSASVVRLVTHSSPGGGSDVFLREMAPHLSKIMGATFVVENLQGGSGAKAMAAIAGAKPDGGMFYATTPTFIYTSLLSQPAARYTDLEPLVNLFFDPEVLYTAADSRFETFQDVLDRGAHRWRQMGRGQSRVARTSDARAVEAEGDGRPGRHHVRRRRRHARQRVESHSRHGHRRAAGDPGQLDAGTIRLLAVVGDDRLPLFPDLQTVKEQGIDLSVRKFRGLAGPEARLPTSSRRGRPPFPGSSRIRTTSSCICRTACSPASSRTPSTSGS